MKMPTLPTDQEAASAAKGAPWNYLLLAMFGRLYPFYSGSTRLTESELWGRLAKPTRTHVWCHGPGGMMLVPLDDFVGRCIYFTRDYDRKITALCGRIVRPGDTVLDVGANMGVVALNLARLVGSKGAVHAFEPNPRMSSLLVQSIARNRYEHLHLYPMALGSQNGVLELNIPLDNAGQGSFIYHKNADGHDTVQTPVRTLTEVVREQGIERIRLIKIDVEGFENEVLLGGMEILERMRPDFLLLEVNESYAVPFPQVPVVQTLQRARYRMMAIPKALLALSVVAVDIHGTNQSPSHDIVAVPEEKYALLSRELGVKN
jgi:FkbM family methyltransferase